MSTTPGARVGKPCQARSPTPPSATTTHAARAGSPGTPGTTCSVTCGEGMATTASSAPPTTDSVCARTSSASYQSDINDGPADRAKRLADRYHSDTTMRYTKSSGGLALAVTDLRVSYGPKRAVDGVSLEIED